MSELIPTTDGMRAKIRAALNSVRPGETASFVTSDIELAAMVKMDLEDALRALGTSQRVLRGRAILVDAMKACQALIESLSDKEPSAPEMAREAGGDE